MVYQTHPPTVNTVRWSSGINAVAGLWLALAPFVLGYTDVTAALWNDIVVGILIIVLALTRVGNPLHYEAASWTNAGIGAWLIAAPFILPYQAAPEALTNIEAAYWNDIIIGVVVLVLALISGFASRRRGI